MKFNTNGSVLHENPLKKRKLLNSNNKGYPGQASRCQGTNGLEPPVCTTPALQSLTFSPCKVKSAVQLLSMNEKQDNCNGKYRQAGVSLKNQESSNDHFAQPSMKKRKLDVIYYSVPDGRLSGKRPSELENEKQRKLTRGKAVDDQSAFPLCERIKREHMRKPEASKEYLLKAALRNRSNFSEFGKIKNISRFDAQCTGGEALQRHGAEKSCSSVSSSESFTARDLTSLDKQGLSSPLPHTNDDNLESYPLHINVKDEMIISGEKEANEVHQLESLAYRSVLNALRARGPLDWHQELLLTDLRLSLHITNDEHRVELTHMCSTEDVQL